MKVFVVTNVESGWDCVRGVYKTKKDACLGIIPEDVNIDDMSDKELEQLVENEYDRYIIHETTLI